MSELNTDYIDQYQITAEAYARLTDNEQQALNDAYVKELKETGKSDEQIEKALDELKTGLEELSETYADYVDELEDLLRGDLSDAKQADLAELIDQCNDIINEMEEADGRVEESFDNYNRHNRTFGTGEDAAISDLTLDGQTYVYEINGGNVFINTDSDYQWTLVSTDTNTGTYVFKVTDSNGNNATVEFQTNNTADLFGNDEQTDEEYLLEQKVTNEAGVVIADVNADGFMNQSDIDYALETRDAQKTDPLTDTTTQFFFSSGLNSDHLETLKTTWPEELLKICYWGDSNNSFYDELFDDEEEKEGVPDPSIIQGYSETAGAYGTVTSSYDLSASAAEEGGLSVSQDVLQETYQEAIDLLYGHLADPSKDINEIWQEIYKLCSQKGFGAADTATLMQSIVLGLATSDPDHITQLIPSSAVSTIENYLLASQQDDDNRLTVIDKTVIMVLEEFVGPGLYANLWSGGTFSADGSADGEWPNNEENVSALQMYNLIRSEAGLGVSTSATAAIEQEEKRSETQKKEKEGDTVAYKESQADKLSSHVGEYAHKFDRGGINEKKFASYLSELTSRIVELWESGASVEKIRKTILNYIDDLPKGKFKDDVAATITLLLYDYAPTLYKALFKGNFKEKMAKYVYNGGFGKPQAARTDRFPLSKKDQK